jgi:hypothetical protein
MTRELLLAAGLLLSACTLPTVAPGAYQLACGPLERSKCKDAASEIVRDAGVQQPTNAVLSITFTDSCGSSIVAFGNGTTTRTMVECITGG